MPRDDLHPSPQGWLPEGCCRTNNEGGTVVAYDKANQIRRRKRVLDLVLKVGLSVFADNRLARHEPVIDQGPNRDGEVSGFVQRAVVRDL